MVNWILNPKEARRTPLEEKPLPVVPPHRSFPHRGFRWKMVAMNRGKNPCAGGPLFFSLLWAW
jgi:hypothetical protein